MKNNDIAKFSAIITGLAEEFGGELSKNNLMLKFNTLKNYSLDDIAKAAAWLLKYREKTFPAIPTTHEIVQAIGKGQGQISIEDRAIIESDKILSHLKWHGGTTYPDLSDPVTKHLMTSRWPYKTWASHVIESELTWWKKEFEEAYRAYNTNDISALPAIEGSSKVKELVNGIG